jgi:hypothetical protein
MADSFDAAHLASLGPDERLALLDRVATVGLDHALAARDEREALWLIESLTKDRYQKSRESLLAIWTSTGYPNVREAARRGLDKLGERSARRAGELQSMLERNAIAPSSEPLPYEPSRLVAELFALQPATAFDRLGAYVAPASLLTFTGAAIARWVFRTLATSPHWVRSKDPRWIDAAARVARDERVATYAKGVLSQADPAAVRKALARAKALGAEAPVAEPPGGIESESDDDLRETMARVRRNLERIIARLQEGSYKLKRGKRALQPPAPSTAKAIATIEKNAGHAVPRALRAFWEIVGAVDLSEGNAAYDEDESLFELLGQSDPLVVVDPKQALALARPFNDSRAQDPPDLRGPFVLYVGRDPSAKYDPDGKAFDEDPHLMPLEASGGEGMVRSRKLGVVPFVDYLRQYVRGGGFRGLSQTDARDDPDWAGLRILTEGLEPF